MAPILDPVNFFSVLTLLADCGYLWTVSQSTSNRYCFPQKSVIWVFLVLERLWEVSRKRPYFLNSNDDTTFPDSGLTSDDWKRWEQKWDLGEHKHWRRVLGRGGRKVLWSRRRDPGGKPHCGRWENDAMADVQAGHWAGDQQFFLSDPGLINHRLPFERTYSLLLLGLAWCDSCSRRCPQLDVVQLSKLAIAGKS